MSIAQIREAAGTAAGIAKISDEKILPQSARAVGHLAQPRYESPIARKIQKHRIPDDLSRSSAPIHGNRTSRHTRALRWQHQQQEREQSAGPLRAQHPFEQLGYDQPPRRRPNAHSLETEERERFAA